MKRVWARQRAGLFSDDAGPAAAVRERGRPRRRERLPRWSGAPRRRTGLGARLEAGGDLTRRDFKHRGGRARPALPWAQIGLGLIVAALLLASLRLGILRTRYELADALETETRLLEQERATTVEVRRLRDPERLQRLALERGFALPERVLELKPTGPADRP